ncbi:MAG: hypothetical protein ACYC3W_11070 [Candidatus Nanopelagicales bacterium]
MSELEEDQLSLAVPTAWSPTGDIRVDSAAELVKSLAEMPLSEHQQVFEDVHRRLHDALADATGH